jgi:hypothetical protein
LGFISVIHSDCDFLNRMVAVAEPVPFRKFGLNSACTVHCTRTERGWPGNLDACHQLPALPRLPARLADQVGQMPSAARVYIDPLDRSHARPSDTRIDQVEIMTGTDYPCAGAFFTTNRC